MRAAAKVAGEGNADETAGSADPVVVDIKRRARA
jgi:hypothetical protein